MNISTSNGGVVDPPAAEWHLTTDTTSQGLGKIIGAGFLPATVTPTGRTVFGYPEYTVSVKLPKAFTLAPGEYWLSVAPYCGKAKDTACNDTFFDISNTDGLNSSGHREPANQAFYLSQQFVPLCDISMVGCSWLSAGAVGTVDPEQ